jgi:hypothetical protein
MSLEFAIIPSSENLQQYAHEIESKLKQIKNMDIDIHIDLNYQDSFNSRTNKWKKKECDIIIINEDFLETKYIHVKFSEKKSKTSVMEIDEFIELISSFEDDIVEHKDENSLPLNNKNKPDKNIHIENKDKESESVCIIC